MLLKLKKELQQPEVMGLLVIGFLISTLIFIVSLILRSAGKDTYIFSIVCVLFITIFVGGLLFSISGYGSIKHKTRKHPHYTQIKKIEKVILSFRKNVQQNPDIIMENNILLGDAETRIDKMLTTFYHGFNNTDVMWYIENVFEQDNCLSLLKKLDQINNHPLLLEEFKNTPESMKQVWLEPLLDEAETINHMLKSEDYLLDTLLELNNLTSNKRQELEKRQKERNQAKDELSDMMK